MKKGFSIVRFRSIILKEFLQIKKDPASLAIALILPVMLLVLLGYAMNEDVEQIDVAIMDASQSNESRELIQTLTSQDDFNVVDYKFDSESLEHVLDSGEAKAAIMIPATYSNDLYSTEASVQVLVDGSNPTYAQAALSRSEQILTNHSIALQEERLLKEGISSSSPPFTQETQVLYNPNMESLKFNIPALIGLIMQEVTLILTAFALVREKEQGTIEQLIVTPIRPSELILGKLVPYTIIGVVSFFIVLLAGTYWFKVSIAGNVGLLIALSFLFLVATLAMGIFISTLAKNQLQAMYMSFAVILPSVILSGFVFPRESMPVIIQWLGGIIPLTYFLEILRGVFLKASTLEMLWSQTAVLLGFIAIFSVATIIKFKKQLQ